MPEEELIAMCKKAYSCDDRLALLLILSHKQSGELENLEEYVKEKCKQTSRRNAK